MQRIAHCPCRHLCGLLDPHWHVGWLRCTCVLLVFGLWCWRRRLSPGAHCVAVQYKVPGAGSTSPEAPIAGDLVVNIQRAEDSRFVRDGADVYMRVNITLQVPPHACGSPPKDRAYVLTRERGGWTNRKQ